MLFSDRLRALIEERDITQKYLAGQLGIPVSTLGGYVQGTSEPDFATLKLLAAYFRVSTDYLLGFGGEQLRSEEENELLRIFRALSGEQRELYLEQGRAIVRINARGAARSSRSAQKDKHAG